MVGGFVRSSRFIRADFDPAREFKVVRPFVSNGKLLALGVRVEKRVFPVRRLRQLYDARYIEFDGTAQVAAPVGVSHQAHPPVPPPAPAAEPVTPLVTSPARPGGGATRRPRLRSSAPADRPSQ